MNSVGGAWLSGPESGVSVNSTFVWSLALAVEEFEGLTAMNHVRAVEERHRRALWYAEVGVQFSNDGAV